MKRFVLILEGNGFVNHYVQDKDVNECLNQLLGKVKEMNSTDLTGKCCWVAFNDCFFDLKKLQGMYITESTLDTQERLTKAAEKMADSLDEGENWKKKDE